MKLFTIFFFFIVISVFIINNIAAEKSFLKDNNDDDDETCFQSTTTSTSSNPLLKQYTCFSKKQLAKEKNKQDLKSFVSSRSRNAHEQQQEDISPSSSVFSSLMTTVMANCSNLGIPTGPDSCNCPLPQFSGPECITRMCNKDGTAIEKPNNKTNTCSCQDPAHNEGISCQLCKNGDAGCPPGFICDESILSISTNDDGVDGDALITSNVECGVVGESLNAILGGTGIATYNCMLPNQGSSSSANNNNKQEGNCSVSFFRKNSDPVTYDNYFHCNLEKCTATKQLVDKGTSDKISTSTRHLFAFARVVVLLLMVCFVGFRFVSTIPTRARLVAAFSAITFFLLALLMLSIWVVSSQSSENNTETMIVYDCDKSDCQCYPDNGHTEAGGDACADQMFGQQILPILISGATLKCELGGGFTPRKCSFLQKDLGTEVELSCKGSVCKKKNQQHISPPGTSGGAINQTTANSTSDGYTFFSAVKQKLTSTVVIILVTIFGISALIFYASSSMKESKRMSEEFGVRFLSSRVAVHGDHNTDDSNNNNNNDHMNAETLSTSTESDNNITNSRNNNNNNNNNKRGDRAMADIFLPQTESQAELSPSTPTQFPSNGDEEGTTNNNNNNTAAAAVPRHHQHQQHSSSDNTHYYSSTSTPELFSLSTMNLCYSVQNTTSTTTSNNHHNQNINNNSASNTTVIARTNVLRNVSVNLPGGHLVAILGASGSSKTSLLEALSGTLEIQGEMSGAVMADHREIFPNPNHDSYISKEFQCYCAVSSFVAQQDILLASLTVREAIYYSGRLKLPAVLESNQVMEIVDIILELLHLQECADRLIGGGTSDIRGLSGGERRRVSIATELVGLPRFILLDECCSGLDASNALHVAECLADIARGRSRLHNHPALGKYAHYRPLVVFSVHQPSEAMYSLFDTTILMNKGRAVYCGASTSALPFLLEHVREEIMANTISLTVPERLLSISDSPDYELDKAAAATSKSMMASIVASSAADGSGSSSNSANDDGEGDSYSNHHVRQSISTPTRSSLNPSSSNQNHHHPIGGDWLNDEEGASANRNAGGNLSHHTTTTAIANPYFNQQQQELQAMRERVEMTPISRVQLAANNRARYSQPWVSQVGYLIIRGWKSTNVTNYNIMFAHATATLFIGSALALLYRAEPLTLAGALDRAGSMTYMLLVTAFLSLSAIDWIVSERRLLHFERRNHCYGTAQYFISKFFVDFLPYRAVPSAALSILVYAPMGLRTDGGSYFAWFALVNGLFAIQTSAMTMCAAALVSNFGAAALLSAIIILWNFVFCGLLIQAGTLPAFFIPFRDISPFFLAFEALLVNELDGQNCRFAPVDAAGKPSSHEIPLFCRQYLYNLGLKPENFSRDVLTLGMWCGFFICLAGLCLHGVPEWVRVLWARFQRFTCRKCCASYYYSNLGDYQLNQQEEQGARDVGGELNPERTPLTRRDAEEVDDE